MRYLIHCNIYLCRSWVTSHRSWRRQASSWQYTRYKPLWFKECNSSGRTDLRYETIQWHRSITENVFANFFLFMSCNPNQSHNFITENIFAEFFLSDHDMYSYSVTLIYHRKGFFRIFILILIFTYHACHTLLQCPF